MTVIFGRNDLTKKAMNKPMGDITLEDVYKSWNKQGRTLVYEADVILFRDRSGRTRVMKNRYGKCDKEMYIEVQDEDWIKIR